MVGGFLPVSLMMDMESGGSIGILVGSQTGRKRHEIVGSTVAI